MKAKNILHRKENDMVVQLRINLFTLCLVFMLRSQALYVLLDWPSSKRVTDVERGIRICIFIYFLCLVRNRYNYIIIKLIYKYCSE